MAADVGGGVLSAEGVLGLELFGGVGTVGVLMPDEPIIGLVVGARDEVEEIEAAWKALQEIKNIEAPSQFEVDSRIGMAGRFNLVISRLQRSSTLLCD
jgi:hypothetical protein